MQVCSRCVMDTTDPDITFDQEGVCSHCHAFDQNIQPFWNPGSPESTTKITQLVDTIKRTQKDKEYDAIIGLSGGVDSSYLAHWAVKNAGLRLLAVHVDAGWNSELAVQNIEKIVKILGIDLYTHVVDWEAMRDVQLAFFKSGVANQDTPQDHAFFSSLYRFAVKNKIKYVLSGSNLATESILPSSWEHDAMDWIHVKDICHQFGAKAFQKFPGMPFLKRYFYFPYIKRMQVVKPLNYIPYNKQQAIQLLEQEMGWKYYGGKHYESRFTKFFQGYWLPTKYGYDKRKAHLSSIILSGGMTREEALKELENPLYEASDVEVDMAFLCKKLGISVDDFKTLMKQPNTHYTQFKHNGRKLKALRLIAKILRKCLPRFRSF